MNEQYSQMIKSAVKWWSDKLGHYHISELGNGDAQEREYTNTVNLFMSLLETPEVTDEQITTFEQSLSEQIGGEISRKTYTCIGVDYHPDVILSTALTDAGIKIALNLFPLKTMMYINTKKGIVTVREGYGAITEQIFPKESENES
jgi:hypothetical protein